MLNFRPLAVAYILYKQAAAEKYSTFQIPKRNGGHRTIMAPTAGLKLLQRNLSDLLQDCVDEINAATNRQNRLAHGFVRKRSIITNAKKHRNRRWVFNLDLEDFFPSINFGRVRGFLLKNRDFRLHQDVATVIAQIACHDNTLPQGSPCSPVVSNLVANVLDVRLAKVALAARCTYSRYADDLTFSTNKREFPADIAVRLGPDGPSSHTWLPSEALQKLIERTGFRVNASKTRLMYRSSRQEVTGLVINKKLSVRCEYRHNVRAMVHRLITTGTFEVYGVTRRNGQELLERRAGTHNELRGMLSFINSIDIYNHPLATDPKSDPKSAPRFLKEKPYRQFLFYSMLYATPAPVIICEGKTDNVYLTHAIRSLAAEFPDLAEASPDGKIRLKVRLCKYAESSTGRILGLKDGGSNALKDLMVAYRDESRRFTGPGLEQPVLVLYDDDDGAKPIRTIIKKVFKVHESEGRAFVHVFKNMYAVPTPGKPSKIEDFFEASIKAVKLGGKTFHPEKGFDPAKHYGKAFFAEKVVAPNAKKIDFTSFRPLLKNLVAAIQKHRTLIIPSSSR